MPRISCFVERVVSRTGTGVWTETVAAWTIAGRRVTVSGTKCAGDFVCVQSLVVCEDCVAIRAHYLSAVIVSGCTACLCMLVVLPVVMESASTIVAAPLWSVTSLVGLSLGRR